jgi:uncharacterized membrane protein YedE/YeeE
MLLGRCPWYVAGPLLGVLLIAFRAALNRPFGALGGFTELVEKRGARPRVGVSGFVLLGTVLGGAAFALASTGFEPTWIYSSDRGFLPAEPALAPAVLILSGGVMGFGARWAGGCTSGHGLTGMSLASPASIAASVTFFATAVLLAHILNWFAGGAS